MATDKDEEKRRANAASLAFLERIKRDHPRHATLYCEHGNYIGFKALFREACSYCMGEVWEVEIGFRRE